MKYKISIIAIVGISLSISIGFAQEANEEKEVAARIASITWLALVDDSKYTESWGTAAEYFKNVITAEKWEQSAKAVRKPVGKIQSRILKSIKFKTELPGVPDGEYFIIQYNTSFENKMNSVETNTLMRDKDGRWRVVGYFVK